MLECYILITMLCRNLRAVFQGITANTLTDPNGSGQEEYLKARVDQLSPLERHYVIMYDEIHVRESVQYSGGQLHGYARNKGDTTLTKQVQSYMMASVFGHHKEVISMVPVQGQDGQFIAQHLIPAIECVQRAGGTVVATVSDNAGINGIASQRLCGVDDRSRLPMSFEHSGQQIAIMFDAPHIIKCHRNNWYNQACFSVDADFDVLDFLRYHLIISHLRTYIEG